MNPSEAALLALTTEDLQHLTDGMRLLDAAYADYYARSDGYGKSYEGGITVYLGNYFERGQGRVVSVEVATYVFGYTRREDFATAADFHEWATATHERQLAEKYDQYGDRIEDEQQKASGQAGEPS